MGQDCQMESPSWTHGNIPIDFNLSLHVRRFNISHQLILKATNNSILKPQNHRRKTTIRKGQEKLKHNIAVEESHTSSKPDLQETITSICNRKTDCTMRLCFKQGKGKAKCRKQAKKETHFFFLSNFQYSPFLFFPGIQTEPLKTARSQNN